MSWYQMTQWFFQKIGAPFLHETEALCYEKQMESDDSKIQCCLLLSPTILKHFAAFQHTIVRVHSELSTIRVLLVQGRKLLHMGCHNIIQNIALTCSADIFCAKVISCFEQP